MPDVTAERFFMAENGDTAGSVDTLLAAEVGDPQADRGIDLHVSPREKDVVTCCLRADEAWALARELARCATEMELA